MASEEEEHEEQFRDMVIELLLFISLNGVARPSHKKDTVIYRYSESTLANWIDFIQKMNRKEGDYLSTEQTRILQQAGFPFQQTDEELWENGYNNLIEYKAINNHCDAPRRDEINGRWVAHQRSMFKSNQEGKITALTDERIEKLENIGFKFSVKEKPEDTWEKQYAALVVYNDTHGNCSVPCSYCDENGKKTLANWVKKQRKKYKAKLNNKKSTLTDIQIKKLDSIGFKWDGKK